jgi:hypothetical protein
MSASSKISLLNDWTRAMQPHSAAREVRMRKTVLLDWMGK